MSDAYSGSAELYDRLYHFKDYAKDCLRLRSILATEGIETGANVLEAACGTGSYIGHLSSHFRVSGFDLSPEMLAVARAKLPGVNLFQADMADFSLLEPCDALLCLFSSIGYVYPRENLEKAARCFAKAVRPGGCLVVEPWLSREALDEGRPTVQTYNDEHLALARMCVTKVEGELTAMEFEYMVAFRDHQVERFTALHKLWMAPRELYLEVFDAAGFDIRFEEVGLMPERGLFVGTRR